jgi:hypothetical protein
LIPTKLFGDVGGLNISLASDMLIMFMEFSVRAKQIHSVPTIYGTFYSFLQYLILDPKISSYYYGSIEDNFIEAHADALKALNLIHGTPLLASITASYQIRNFTLIWNMEVRVLYIAPHHPIE